MPYNFIAIEKKWQQYWLTNKTFAALDPSEAGDMRKAYILDMFPYPSGSGLHVGHPEGYTATDIVSRYLRMKGYNVLHPMGWDAFGLPAEQYAIKTNTHPKITTEKNIANFRRQIQMLGLSYDWDREVDTTDPSYYKWTQWIFLQLFNSYFDPIQNKAMPISHLEQALENEALVVGPDGSVRSNRTSEGLEPITGEIRLERLWREIPAEERRDIIDGQRLAYTDEVPVNWCPGLGTVLANEEVIDGRSEVGGFPVERRPMRQWMLRITAYADRLIADLDSLSWPESLKEMQRNWIGRSTGAEVDFNIDGTSLAQPEDDDAELEITVFTTRPDTLYGATYMVLAPEHPLVDRITSPQHRESIEAYRAMVSGKSDRDRMSDTKEKTGIFTGAHALNPLNNEKIPVYIADYVLMGYGTGAIMAVPAHDERDFSFARKFDIPIKTVVLNPELEKASPTFRAFILKSLDRIDAEHALHVAGNMVGSKPGEIATTIANFGLPVTGVEIEAAPEGGSYLLLTKSADPRVLQIKWNSTRYPLNTPFIGEGTAIHSNFLDGLSTSDAKNRMISHLESEGVGRGTIKYKLRDWLFSRQRYWGEPFPIILDSEGRPSALSEKDLPLTLPQIEDFKPTGTPEPPLSKATQWLNVSPGYLRETNTMPQWAGSCWYYLRYIDPKNPNRFVDPEKEKYWMPVDLYVGGVEHAVLHLLYSRFWHKVLFDLGHVSTSEPFGRLVNQGLILGETEYHFFESPDGKAVSTADIKDIAEEATNTGLKLAGIQKSTNTKIFAKPVPESLVEKKPEGYVLKANSQIRVDARSFKMSKSRGNVVNPDTIVADYGADTFRLYEMYMGPLEAQKPWNTRDIVGMARFLNSVWRNLVGDEENNKVVHIEPVPVPETLDRMMHRTIKKVAEDIEGLRFNTAIAELIKLNNEMLRVDPMPRELAENFALMLAPLAPHIAEELWAHLGHTKTLSRRPWPTYDPAKLVESTMELPVQVNGKLRGKITLPADATEAQALEAAAAVAEVRPWLEGKDVKKRIYVPKKLVSFVVA